MTPYEGENTKHDKVDNVTPSASTTPNGDALKLDTDKVEKDVSKVNFTEGGVESFKFYPDNPENHRHKYRWAMKEPSKFYDPCEESRMASMDCLYRNQQDKYACQEFFDAYRECRKDFFRKRKQDRIQGKGGWGW